jgi:hypothetical protein
VDLREDGVVWIGLMWFRIGRALVNAVMNLKIPQNVGKFLSSCAIGGFSRRASSPWK